MFKSIARQTARHSATATAGRRYAHTPSAFDWKDPLGSSNLFTEDELAIAETAESYCQERMLPRVLGMMNTTKIFYLAITDLPIQRHTVRKITIERY